MRFLPAFALAALALFLPTSVTAAIYVLGPTQYQLQSGKPLTFESDIVIDPATRCDGKAAYVLEVRSSGISSATVSINSKAVFRESDFSAQPKTLEAPVVLNDSNRMRIELKGGAAGGSLTVAIRKEIEEPLAASSHYVLTAKKQTFEETVNVAAPGAAYVLVVESSGAAAVKSGAVRINGIEVVQWKDAALLRRVVTLQATNAIRTELQGEAGNEVVLSLRALRDEAACGGMRVLIVTPAENETVTEPSLFVTGTLTSASDAGLSVNGVPAALDLSHGGTAADPYRWVAEVSAEAGQIVITATATNGRGRTATATRAIVFAPDPARLRITSSPGLPMKDDAVTFSLWNVPAGPAVLEADLDGDGIFEIGQATTTLPPITYTTAGLRRVAIRVLTGDGGSVTAMTWLSVGDIATIDPILQQRWNDFRAALARGDVPGATALMASSGAREKYTRALQLFGAHLPDVAADMAGIVPVYVRGDFAKYLLIRSGGGREAAFYVYFVRNSDGFWRIAQF